MESIAEPSTSQRDVSEETPVQPDNSSKSTHNNRLPQSILPNKTPFGTEITEEISTGELLFILFLYLGL